MSEPRMWVIVWREAAGDREERFWGTIVVESGCVVRLTHYSGGVGGLPWPMEERVVPLDRIAEWRSDR